MSFSIGHLSSTGLNILHRKKTYWMNARRPFDNCKVYTRSCFFKEQSIRDNTELFSKSLSECLKEVLKETTGYFIHKEIPYLVEI